MYNQFGTAYVPLDIIERLEAFEAAAGVPLRLIVNNRNARENRWPAEQYAAFERDVARERGITISFGDPNGSSVDYPRLWWTRQRFIEVGQPGPDYHADHEPLLFDHVLDFDPVGLGYGTPTNQFGAVDVENRVVYVFAAMMQMYYEDDWDTFLRALWEPIFTALNELTGGQLTDEELAARREERARAAFNRYVERVYEAQLTKCRTRIDQLTNQLSSAHSTIASVTHDLTQQQQMLDALLLVQENDASSKMRQEWELLASHPRLASRTQRGNTLVLTTTDDLRLHRDDSEETRWLGAFEIRIDLTTFTINIRNLNTMRGGRHHPHIPGDGSPCFGRHATGFYELLGQGQLYTCYDLLLQYLETVNLRDEWGRYASYWFEQEDERPLLGYDEPAEDEAEAADETQQSVAFF